MFRASRTIVVCLACSCALWGCCRKASGIDALLGDRAGMPAPSSDGSCAFDLAPGKAATVFYVLGYLDEYLGRTIVEDGDRIEGLYCNEQERAPSFGAILVRLALEQGLDPAIREEIRQECLVSFHSRAIAARLDSCYRYQLSSASVAQAEDGTYRRLGKGTLELTMFVRRSAVSTAQALDHERALSYIAGAWARYGRGDAFVFANSHEKATRIAQLLTMLGCRDVRLESNFGYIPQTNILRFTPTAELREWISKPM